MIGFFQAGDFSQQNNHVAAILHRGFPGEEISAVDVVPDIAMRSPLTAARAFVETLKDYRKPMLRQRHDPRVYFPKTRALAAAIRARSARDFSDALFTFQTQSLFDASSGRAPHFLYTDHTLLANHRYTDQTFAPEIPAHWPARERTFYERADVCFTTSEFIRASLIEDYGLPPERVECVWCGANTEPPAIPAAREWHGGRILFVGIEWERKGGPDLLRAFERVVRAVPTAQLVIAGCSPAAPHPAIRVLGRLPLEEISKLYGDADLFCMPSRKEPAGVVFSEAGLRGLPSVATRSGGIPDRVLDGDTGFLVEPGDIDALADRLITLCRDREKCRAMGEAARLLATERFTWQAVGERMIPRIRAVLDQRRG